MQVRKFGGARRGVRFSPLSFAFFTLIALLAACSPAPEPTPSCELPPVTESGLVQATPYSGELTIIENEGYLCFYPTPDASFNVQVSAVGCHASYCTLVYERSGDMDMDLETKTLQFTSRFMLQDARPLWPPGVVCGCAADCGGAGDLRFDTPRLPDGVYGVYLGDVQIGQLTVPFYDLHLCLDSAATATTIPPTPLPSPTRAPADYPPPGTPTPFGEYP